MQHYERVARCVRERSAYDELDEVILIATRRSADSLASSAVVQAAMTAAYSSQVEAVIWLVDDPVFQGTGDEIDRKLRAVQC
jgi:hypothetical protein